MSTPEALLSSARTGGSDLWITPPEIVRPWLDRYGVRIDAAAGDREASRCLHFIDPARDALATDWLEFARARDVAPVFWLNMPYSLCEPFLEKAWAESRKGATVLCLINANTDTRVWHRRVMQGPSQVHLSEGRISFLAGEDIYRMAGGQRVLSMRKGERASPVKGNALVVYAPYLPDAHRPIFFSWKLPK